MSKELETYTPTVEQNGAVQRLADWAQSAQAAYSVAEKLVVTSFVPDVFRNKPHEATAAILAGLEVGLSPMASLRSFDIIAGQAAPKAMTLRAIVQSAGHKIQLVESTNERCVIDALRKGDTKWQRVEWTVERAQQLGLAGKQQWKTQPKAMLVARATAEAARLVASDALLGLAGGYAAEELDGSPPIAEPSPPPTPRVTIEELAEQAATQRKRTKKTQPAEPIDEAWPPPPVDETGEPVQPRMITDVDTGGKT